MPLLEADRFKQSENDYFIEEFWVVEILGIQHNSRYTEFRRKMMKWKKSDGFITKATVL